MTPVFTPGVTRLENWLPQPRRRCWKSRPTRSTFTTTGLPGRACRSTSARGSRWWTATPPATSRTVDTNTIVPRLGAAYDLTGTGHWIAQATYGHYAGKPTRSRNFQDDSRGGQPEPGDLRIHGSGGPGQWASLPGFDPANYTRFLGGNFPTANVALRRRDPVARDQGVHGGVWRRRFGDRGAAKVQLPVALDERLRRGLHRRSDGRGQGDWSCRNGVTLGTFDRVTVPQQQHAGARLPGADVPRPTAGCRASGPWTATGRCS